VKEHYNSVLKITVSFLRIHKYEPDIYIGFSPALHLQCGYPHVGHSSPRNPCMREFLPLSGILAIKFLPITKNDILEYPIFHGIHRKFPLPPGIHMEVLSPPLDSHPSSFSSLWSACEFHFLPWIHTGVPSSPWNQHIRNSLCSWDPHVKIFPCSWNPHVRIHPVLGIHKSEFSLTLESTS
jgi:hypothetical protein